jgi:GT2 family glycosyltransferase
MELNLNTTLNTSVTHNLTKFSIALVNYKTLELTKICLDLLKKHFDSGDLDKDRVDVWVVDNHSQDASVEYLRTLNWINLIERTPTEYEEGFVAHGKGLDLILARIDTDHLFLLHTDTFIYDPSVFDWMLEFCKADVNVVAVGCLEQLNRGYIRTAWRIGSRFCKHYSRRLRLAMGFNARQPKHYKEEYIKSFCALWNVKLIKQCGYSFLMANRVPGYALQDKLKLDGYKLKVISPMKLFKFLDHVEAGTVGLRASYSDMNRRIKRKKSILKKLEG